LLAGLVLLCLSYLSRFAQTKFMPVNGGKTEKKKIWRGASGEDGGDLALSAIYSIVIGVIAFLAFI